jgi:uncharacterized membrane protein YbhN (UPF0104 family)
LEADFLIILFVPPLIALACSFYAKSRAAFWILRAGSIWYLVTALMLVVVDSDCSSNYFSYRNCQMIPDGLIEIYSAFYLLNLLSYMFISPALVLVALGLEIYHRRKQASDTLASETEPVS